MKRLLALFLSLVLMLCAAVPAYATGDGNFDGGGGGMGSGTSTNYWNPGMDGVRISVVNVDSHAVVGNTIDWSNQNPSTNMIHFGKVSKLSYNSGRALSPVVGGYVCVRPAQSLPRIISTGDYPASIAAIRSYFTDEQVIRAIAGYVGIDFDTLIAGDYKIVVEPIAYFVYGGAYYAMTATEAALYDQKVNGDLRRKMGSLTHKNLPLAIFLEEADLGYPAWSGSTNSKVSNDQIISSLGIGVVRFNGELEPPDVNDFDYEYRVDTDVISSVEVSGGQSDPDNPVTVRFVIQGRTYTVSNVYYPDGDSQLVWVKWHTPSEPCVITIAVSVSGGGTAQSTITCNVVDLDGNDPPNPVADDRNDSFSPSAVPSRAEKTSAQWSIWRPWWYAYWVWHSTGKDSGYWCDHGWWEFDLDRYSASLSASMTITPDTMNPTASGTTMKSGYGINEVVTARVSSSQRSATTALQNAVSYFPEFNYDSFWRLLDRVSISSSSSRLEFQTNEYSTYNRRTHFTPIWYPDGAYTVNTWVIDCWTPVGMLSVNLSDTLTISGNLWDDWHIAPMR